MNGIKRWKDWLHPIATVLGAWGGFPKPPKIFLELTRFELFRWFLVFTLAYQGGAEEDVRQALIITVIFYLITKLLDLRDVVSDVAYSDSAVIRHQDIRASANLLAQKDARAASAEVQAVQTAAHEVSTDEAQAEAQAQAAEAFYGGYYL